MYIFLLCIIGAELIDGLSLRTQKYSKIFSPDDPLLIFSQTLMTFQQKHWQVHFTKTCVGREDEMTTIEVCKHCRNRAAKLK